MRNQNGSLGKKWGGYSRYDLSDPEVQERWTEEVLKTVVDGSCDGVFADSFPQIPSKANIKLWGRENYDAIQAGLIGTPELTLGKISSEGLIVYNCFRNTDTLSFGMQYLYYTDAATIEHFGHFLSDSKRVRVLALVPARRRVGRNRTQASEDRFEVADTVGLLKKAIGASVGLFLGLFLFGFWTKPSVEPCFLNIGNILLDFQFPVLRRFFAES